MKLKNTPWTAQRDNSLSDFTGREHWEVLDSEGYTISQDISDENAKAIAALPDTLKRLGELEEFVNDLQDDLSGLNTLEIGDRLKTVLEK